MAVTSKVYGPALLSFANAEIDFDTNTIKGMLATVSYVPNQDTHRYKSDITNEVVGTGYTAGGLTLTGKAATYTAATNAMMLDCNDLSWATSTITARYLIFYKDTGTAATSPLIAYVDFGEDRSSGGTTFLYSMPATGIAQFFAA
jgi:hypothetical protein